MEELLNHPLVSLTLAPNFNQQQWGIITQEKPTLHQAHMQTLSRMLERNLPSTAVPYYKFMQNNLTLAQWQHQNPRLQYQIQQYLFSSQRGPARPKIMHSSSAPKIIKTEPSAVKKYFAETIGLPPWLQNMEVEPVDSYGLYMQTFSACRGKRYSPYDYQKHMKSSQQRVKYNDFIRTNHKRNFTNLSHKKENSLEHFQEWHLNHFKKTSLLNVRKILQDITLNNEQGINRLLKRQGATKLVLLNHQRKPINYYLRTTKRQSQAH